MQLSDIRTRVRERLGLTSADASVSDAILTQFINAANRKLAVMHDWPWLVKTDTTWTATVSGTIAYTPAADWRKTIYVVMDTDQLLTYKQPQDAARLAGVQGYPLWYTTKNAKIEVYPKPDAAYTISHVYIAEVADLSNDTDTPEIASAAAEQWAVDALIEYAALLVAIRLKDYELFQMIREEWARTIAFIQDEVRKSKGYPTPRHRNDIGW